MSKRIKVLAGIKLSFDGVPIEFGIRPKEDSNIFKHDLLDKADMPNEFFEVHAFNRTTKELRGSIRVVKTVVNVVNPIYFAVSQGKPILWICSKEHADFHKSIINKTIHISHWLPIGALLVAATMNILLCYLLYN